MKEQDFLKTRNLKTGFLKHPIHFPGNILRLICISLISLFIFCPPTWSLDKSSLDGIYVMYMKSSNFNGGTAGAWGSHDVESVSKVEINFNGAGSWSVATGAEYSIMRQISEASEDWGSGGDQDHVLSNRFVTTNPSQPISGVSGTYTVSDNGALVVSFTDTDGSHTMYGYINEDGKTIILRETRYVPGDQYGFVEIGVGFKKGSDLNLASLDGTYVMVMQSSRFDGSVTGGWGSGDAETVSTVEVSFDGTGGWSTSPITEHSLQRQITEDDIDWSTPYVNPENPGNKDHVLSNRFNTTFQTQTFDGIDDGTYTVDGYGAVDLSFTDDEGSHTMYGHVNEDGKTIIIRDVKYVSGSYYGLVELGVGVKQGSGLDESDLSGVFVWHGKMSKFDGGVSGAWGSRDAEAVSRVEVTFDGIGKWTLKSSAEYSIEREISEAVEDWGSSEDLDYVLSNRFNTTVQSQTFSGMIGTYTVSGDGAVVLSFTDDDGPHTMNGFINDAGNMAVFLDYKYVPGSYYGLVEMGVGLKVGDLVSGAPYYAAGVWNFTTDSHTNDCDFTPSTRTDPGTAINQAGTTFTYADDLGIHAGRISGNAYTAKFKYPEAGGIREQTTVINLAGDGKSGTGTEDWDWTDGTNSCSGHSVITVLQQPPVGTHDATGIWNYATGTGDSGTVTITQNGGTFRMVGYKRPRSGRLSDSRYICTVPFPEKNDSDKDGTTTESIVFSLSSSIAGSGSIRRFWTDGSLENWDTDTLTLSKTSTVNSPPNPPTLLSPANGATEVSLTPILEIGTFSDSDPDDTQSKTEFLISETEDFSSTVFKTISDIKLTALTVPKFVLKGEKTYYWCARVYDNHSTGSAWSTKYHFSTEADNDADDDGIPDDQINTSVDLDGDGNIDSTQKDIIKSLDTEVGGGQMGASLKDEDKIISIDSVESIDPDTIISTFARPDMPLGMIAVGLTVDNPVDTAELKVYFSEAPPTGAHWYMYDPVNGWADYTAKGLAAFDVTTGGKHFVSLKIKDWGHGDADGVPNGKVIDPGGIGIAGWVKGYITDAKTGEEITFAQVILTDAGDHELILGALDQGAYISILPYGTYTITVTAPGYVPYTTTIVISDVEAQTLNVNLLPEIKAMPWIPLLLLDE